MEANSVIARLKWTRTNNWKTADAVLVVVRSMLFNPLSQSYESVCELKQDAESQLNIAGQKFHIYTYTINDDLSVSQTAHQSYDAN